MADRHHYVSQFHLRGFIDPASMNTQDPWLWLGDREQQTVSRRAPKNVGWFRGLFNGPGAFANRDLSLESFLANEVEGPAAHALRNWIGLPQGKAQRSPQKWFDTWRGRRLEACQCDSFTKNGLTPSLCARNM